MQPPLAVVHHRRLAMLTTSTYCSADRSGSQRRWVANAIRTIEADFNRSADTHLIPLDLPGYPGNQLNHASDIIGA